MRPPWLDSLLNRRMLICVFTGFTSGLPLYLLLNLVPAWLRTEGVSLKAIGLFALIQFPYTWKFLWSPFLDRYALPWLGRRRGWMAAMQILLLAILLRLGVVLLQLARLPVLGQFQRHVAGDVTRGDAAGQVRVGAQRIEARRLAAQLLAQPLQLALHALVGVCHALWVARVDVGQVTQCAPELLRRGPGALDRFLPLADPLAGVAGLSVQLLEALGRAFLQAQLLYLVLHGRLLRMCGLCRRLLIGWRCVRLGGGRRGRCAVLWLLAIRCRWGITGQ